MATFDCSACRDTGHVFGPADQPFGTREIVECESEACIKRRAIETLEEGQGQRKIFKGGEMKLSVAIKGFELEEKTVAQVFGSLDLGSPPQGITEVATTIETPEFK